MTEHITEGKSMATDLIHEQIEAAAKVLAEGMDYPWEHMPEQGRKNMRALAVKVVTAALAPQQPSQGGGEGGWGIDVSAGREILVYGRCSAIEDEQARYVLNLIAADMARPAPEASGAMTDAQVEAAYVDLQQRRRAAGEALFQSKLGTRCTLCSVGKFAADSNNYHNFHRCDSCGHVPIWDKEGKDFLVHGIAATSKEVGE